MASYKESGVDVEEGYRAVNKYKEHAKRTAIPGLLTGLGSFNGMFEVPNFWSISRPHSPQPHHFCSSFRL